MGRGARGGDRRLPRAARITQSEEIRALFRRGKRRRTRHLDVFVSASPVLRSRIGLVVPKPRNAGRQGTRRIPAAAVRRNRLKRRLREVARVVLLPQMDQHRCFVDVLVRARPEAYSASFADLREELTGLHEWLCSSGA